MTKTTVTEHASAFKLNIETFIHISKAKQKNLT